MKFKSGDLLKATKRVNAYILENIYDHNMKMNTYLAFNRGDMILICQRFEKHNVRNLFQIFDPNVNKMYNVMLKDKTAFEIIE